MRPMAFWVVALAGLGACADIDRIAPGDCGNNVVEFDAGEDCDTIVDDSLGPDLACGVADGSAQQCRYLCDGSECPLGWACEDDGICRAPSGEFEVEDEPVAVIRADQILLADLAGESTAELVARQGGALVVFAVEDEAFAQQLDLSLDHVRGPMFAHDIDRDQYADLLVPAASRFSDAHAQPRIHGLRSDQERLTTAIVPRISVGDVAQGLERVLWAQGVAAGPQGLAEVPVLLGTGQAGLIALVPEPSCAEPASSAVLALPSLDPTALLQPTAARIEPGAAPMVALPTLGQSTVAVLSVARECAPGLCTPITPAATTCVTSLTITDALEFPGPLSAAGCVVFDADADADLDLACHLEDGRIAVALAERGQWASPAPAPALEARTDVEPRQPRGCDASHRILAVGDLDEDGDADLVTPHGVYFNDPTGLRRVYTRPLGDAWGQAVVGDFDGDGAAELVVSTRSAQADCDVTRLSRLQRKGDAYTATPIRNVSNPRELAVGDFDGDGLSDLAAVETSLDARDSALVLYGDTKEALEEKASVGTFDGISGLAVLRSRLATDLNEDLLDDLLISSENGEQLTWATGASERSLLAPLSLPVTPDTTAGLVPWAAMAGTLVPSEDTEETDPPVADLFAVAGDDLWLYRGDDVHHGDAVVHLTGPQRPSAFTDFRTECALWSVARPPQPGGNLLAAVDGHPPALSDPSLPEVCDTSSPPPTLLVARFGAGGETLQARTSSLPTMARSPTAVHVFDFDRSGQDDVLILLSERAGQRSGSLLLVVDPDAGQPLDPASVVDLLPAFDVVAATPIDADADFPDEIAVMTTDGLLIVDTIPGQDPPFTIGPALFDAPSEPPIGQPTQLVTGELDGDGLDDLALLWGPQLFLYPSVPTD